MSFGVVVVQLVVILLSDEALTRWNEFGLHI